MIESLVDFCSQEYSRQGQCPDCKNICPGSCDACLYKDHFPSSGEIPGEYKCKNKILFYTCKYVYKYSSEIDRICSSQGILDGLDALDVLSIGCGPCTELIGIIRGLERKKVIKQINYVGCDPDVAWQPIYDFYNREFALMSNVTFRHSLRDASVAKLGENHKPNLLVLNYVISDMVKKGKDVERFLQHLVNNIISCMPKGSFVVFNDINHNKQARDYFDHFMGIFNQGKLVGKGYFKDPNETGFVYSYNAFPECSALTCEPPPDHIKEKFSSKEFCHSAFLVAKKVL